MRSRYAWLLNLDGEDELRAGAGYTPSRHMRSLLARLRPSAASMCLGERDVLVDPAEDAPSAIAASAGTGKPRDGLVGRAWLATPSALRSLRARGLRVEPSPSLAVLQRVNHRAFAYDLAGPRLPGARCFAQGDVRAIEHARVLGEVWVKRPFGAAGRSKRRGVIRDGVDGSLLAFLRASITAGRTVIEPHVQIEQEFCIHGFLSSPSRALRLGAACVQSCDSGAWRETIIAPPGALSTKEHGALREAATRMAAALVHAGYFGPFGVDAYRYRAPDGSTRFNPLGELNARFTMGTRVGLGDCHHDALSPP